MQNVFILIHPFCIKTGIKSAPGRTKLNRWYKEGAATGCYRLLLGSDQVSQL